MSVALGWDRVPNALRQRSGAYVARPWPILSVAALIGFYVSLDVALGERILPNVIATPFGLLLLGLHWRRISKTVAISISAITALYLFSGLYAGILFDTGIDGVQRALPAIQFAYTVLPAYGVFLDLTLWKKRDINRMSGAFAAAILIGSILEVYTPFKAVTVAFSEFHLAMVGMNHHDWGTAYRDLMVYGQYRPKLFCSETSYVAISFGLYMTMWALTSSHSMVRTAVLVGGATAIALFVIRSPFCVLPALIWGSFSVLNVTGSRAAFGPTTLLVICIVVPVGLLACSWALLAMFGNRLGQAQTGADWSVIVRTYGAIFVGWRTALSYPIFGAGVGNFEGFQAIQMQTFIDFRVPEYVIRSDFLENLMNNGWGSTLAYFGFIGGALHTLMWLKLIRDLSFHINMIAGLGLLTVIFFTQGGIYTPKAVWPIFIVAAAVYVTARAQKLTPAAANRI